MTPDALRRLVEEIDAGLPPLTRPAALVRGLEDVAERSPGDRSVALATLEAHALLTAGDGLAGTLAGVRRETLVRWDDWTATWDGTHLASGRPARVRALRAWASRDPVLRRALAREARALQPVQQVTEHDDAIVAMLPGAPLSQSADPDDLDRPEVLARMFATAVADLARWERHRLGLPELSGREVLDTPDGVRVVCLTPVAPGPAQVGRIATVLAHWWGDGPETAVDALLAGMQAFPPRDAHEAADQVRNALRAHLVGEHHALRRRSRQVSVNRRAARLHALLDRLEAAVPPPEGRGAVGVDLDGKTTLVESRDGRIRWGPVDGPALIRERDGDLSAREARRLLRARAASPPNARLHAEVGGTAEHTDRICQWVSAAMHLRTIRMLLDASR